MKKIAKYDKDICKLLAFQGIFEILSEIMKNEDNVIVKDCADLLKILMNDFNKNYIRELPCVFNTISELITGEYKENIVDLLITACTTENNAVHLQNQQYFSKLIEKVMMISYPSTGNQCILALKLLNLLIKGNHLAIDALFYADSVDILDNILSYCSLGDNHEENIEILWILIDTSHKISENFISRVTCAPGYIEIPNTIPVFNHILNKIISEKSCKIITLCRTLEFLLHSNESSKQLAVHLPIDMNSGTLLQKISTIWIESISQNSEFIQDISRLLIIWLYESIDTSKKLASYIYNYLPQIISYLEKKIEIGQCYTSIAIGLICLYSKNKEIDHIIIKSIGYSEICTRLEYLYSVQEFNKMLASQTANLIHDKFSFPLIKVYKNAVQAIKMHFLKGITESVPEDQRELAKLVEAQEAVISMHYLKKNNQVDQENSHLLLKIKELEDNIEGKTLEIDELKNKLSLLKYEKSKESRGIVENMISMHQKLDWLEFENSSLNRENKNLHIKIERLLEEIKTYSAKKHEVHADIKLLEAKENLKIQMNEVQYLKLMLTKTETEYVEALNIIGKQELQLSTINIEVPEFNSINENEPLNAFNRNLSIDFPCSIGINSERKMKNAESTQTLMAESEKINISHEITQTLKSYLNIELSEPISYLPKKTMNWFQDSKEALTFFDNLPQKSALNSFF